MNSFFKITLYYEGVSPYYKALSFLLLQGHYKSNKHNYPSKASYIIKKTWFHTIKLKRFWFAHHQSQFILCCRHSNSRHFRFQTSTQSICTSSSDTPKRFCISCSDTLKRFCNPHNQTHAILACWHSNWRGFWLQTVAQNQWDSSVPIRAILRFWPTSGPITRRIRAMSGLITSF